MKRPKKSEYLSLRIDPETKERLERIAEEKMWSNSQLVEQIIQQWLREHPEDGSNKKHRSLY